MKGKQLLLLLRTTLEVHWAWYSYSQVRYISCGTRSRHYKWKI